MSSSNNTIGGGTTTDLPLVDFNVAIVGGEDTGKTALLEALCLHQIQQEEDDENMIYEVRFRMQRPSDKQQQEQRRPVIDNETLLGDTSMMDAQQPQLARKGPRPSPWTTHFWHPSEKPVTKKAKLNDNTSGYNRSYSKDEAATPCKPTNKTKVAVVQDNIKDPKHPSITRRILQVETDEVLVKMKEGTRLNFIDIPGLSNTRSPELNAYVSDKWGNMDCVIVVMNTREGQDYKEHEAILHFIEELRQRKKAIPVLVVCNKMDLCDQVEYHHIYQEKLELLTRVFGGVTPMMDKTTLSFVHDSRYPVVLPTSARDAGFYRLSSILSLDDFQCFHAMACINKLGLQEKGRPVWDTFSDEEKTITAFKMLHDSSKFLSLIGATHFDKLGPILQSFVGTDAIGQVEVLAKKLKYELASMISFETGTMIDKMRSLNSTFDLLKLPKDDLQKKYWELFEDYLGSRMENFRCKLDVECLHGAMNELILYHEFCSQVCWDNELYAVEDKMKRIVSWQIGIVIEQSNNWSVRSWKALLTSERDLEDWKALSPLDWQRIFSSILLLQGERTFNSAFCREVLILEQKRRVFQAHSMCCSSLSCDSTLCTNPDHKMLLMCWRASCGKQGYKEYFDDELLANPNIQKSCELSDRANWGHMAWLFCRFMDTTSKLLP